jgi:two-component system, cell cycle sensor histidine kinase and response regulator CckA
MNATTENSTRHNGVQPYQFTQVASATVLLVEDDPAVRQVTRAVLEIGGYRVLEADGPAAAEHIASNLETAIDLLLTDVVMPGMNGADLARRLRQLRPELVALFMTGYAESELLRLATFGSQQKHIQKPFTVNGLLARVGDALATRWNGRENLQAPQYPSP